MQSRKGLAAALALFISGFFSIFLAIYLWGQGDTVTKQSSGDYSTLNGGGTFVVFLVFGAMTYGLYRFFSARLVVKEAEPEQQVGGGTQPVVASVGKPKEVKDNLTTVVNAAAFLLAPYIGLLVAKYTSSYDINHFAVSTNQSILNQGVGIPRLLIVVWLLPVLIFGVVTFLIGFSLYKLSKIANSIAMVTVIVALLIGTHFVNQAHQKQVLKTSDTFVEKLNNEAAQRKKIPDTAIPGFDVYMPTVESVAEYQAPTGVIYGNSFDNDDYLTDDVLFFGYKFKSTAGKARASLFINEFPLSSNFKPPTDCSTYDDTKTNKPIPCTVVGTNSMGNKIYIAEGQDFASKTLYSVYGKTLVTVNYYVISSTQEKMLPVMSGMTKVDAKSYKVSKL